MDDLDFCGGEEERKMFVVLVSVAVSMPICTPPYAMQMFVILWNEGKMHEMKKGNNLRICCDAAQDGSIKSEEKIWHTMC